MDYGSYDDILSRLPNAGKNVSNKEAQKLAKLANDYQDALKRIEELEKSKGRKAADTVIRTTPRAGKNADKIAQVRAKRADLVTQLKNVRGTAGVGGSKRRGSASLITAEDLKVAKDQAVIIKDIAVTVIEEGAARIEDVITGVRNILKAEMDLDIEDQAVIDALATPAEKPDLTEVGQRMKDLKTEARKLSTVKQ